MGVDIQEELGEKREGGRKRGGGHVLRFFPSLKINTYFVFLLIKE